MRPARSTAGLGAAFGALLALFACLALARTAFAEGGEPVRITITVEGRAVSAELFDNPAAARLAAMFPLTLEMRDFNRAEKMAYPPRKLDLSGAPRGLAPVAGDIAVYAPWGDVCVFYRDSEANGDLVPLGRVTSGLDILAGQEGAFGAVWDKTQ